MKYANYMELMKDFVGDKISAETYQTCFFALLDSGSSEFNKNYDIMQNLFYDVEEYCCDVALRDDGDIDEVGLKNSTQRTLELLDDV